MSQLPKTNEEQEWAGQEWYARAVDVLGPLRYHLHEVIQIVEDHNRFAARASRDPLPAQSVPMPAHRVDEAKKALAAAEGFFCNPTNPQPSAVPQDEPKTFQHWISVGTGMPGSLMLDEFGSQVWSAFGAPPYLVGSALHGKTFRDVDVRLILPDEEYAAWQFGEPTCCHSNCRWVSFCLAYAALGTKLTGLPIDFQIQQQSFANKTYPTQPRSALGMLGLRFKQAEAEHLVKLRPVPFVD